MEITRVWSQVRTRRRGPVHVQTCVRCKDGRYYEAWVGRGRHGLTVEERFYDDGYVSSIGRVEIATGKKAHDGNGAWLEPEEWFEYFELLIYREKEQRANEFCALFFIVAAALGVLKIHFGLEWVNPLFWITIFLMALYAMASFHYSNKARA